MDSTAHPLIVGAGPVGLAAALFLARSGEPPRLIERRAERSMESRALAVNPRTLDILGPSGVAARMLEIGQPIVGVCMWRRDTLGATVSLHNAHPRHPYLLALSQSTSERLLAEAFEAAGGTIERDVNLVGCRAAQGRIEADLEPSAGGARTTVECPWLLAADGAHSTVRASLGIGFPGRAFKDRWSLADVPLRTEFEGDHAHAFLLDRGLFLFLVPVVGDAPEVDPSTPLWRIVSNHPRPLEALVRAEVAGPPVWESEFTVSHRLAATLGRDGVYLAGDAAHVHSPFGARGMNLGIEDAAVFAALARRGRLDEYAALRRPVDGSVVRRVERLTRLVGAASPFDRLLRTLLLPRALRLPPVQHQLKRMATGLDHPMPAVIQAED